MWDVKMLIHKVSIGFIGEGGLLSVLPTDAHPLEMWESLHFYCNVNVMRVGTDL
jgi:hypothetical protein